MPRTPSASRLRVFLNGRLVPYRRAVVPVEDRGFIFGDGIYEVIRCYRGRPFRFDDHLRRLERYARALGLPLPYTRAQLKRAVHRTLRANALGRAEASMYIQVTRGAAPRAHAFPSHARPTVLMIARPVLRRPREALRARGAAAITLPDTRSGLADMKTLNLLPNVLAKQRAVARGAYEAIFVHDGLVTEGASTNVFIVRRGQVLTPPAKGEILAGVTRAVALRLARALRLPVRERRLTLRQVRNADEIFITASITEILPIVRLDGKRVGTGQPGPITQRLWSSFQSLTRR